MSNIIPFKKPENKELDFVTGTAHCMACGHEWHTTITKDGGEGVPSIQCENCGCMKGIWKHFLEVEDGVEVFTCHCCESYLFRILRTGVICVTCGQWQDFRNV